MTADVWLKGRRVDLAEITKREHVIETYELHHDGANLWNVRVPVTQSFDQFAATFQQGILRDFMLKEAGSERLIGYVWSYNYAPDNGTCYVGMIVRPDVIGTVAWYLEGLALFLDFLFANWPLRKVWFEALEHSAEQFQHGLARVGTHEGRLREVAWYGDRYEDMLYWSITRQQWQESPLSRGRTFDRRRRADATQ